ncbi:15353_t:CDS:2, partial [Entrophospora sp. SA101]
MWRYYTINATICHHGALNGLTTETYEAFIKIGDDIYLKIYATGTLSNDEIVYTTSRFHGK